MTDNHGYNKPSEGTIDWHVPLNENFEQMERDIEIRDVKANRGDYHPDMGAKFLATDTGDIYLGDGSNWQPIGTIARLDGNIYVQSSKPADPSENDVWIDTS